MYDLPVRSITLFALGGVAQIEKESPNAKVEFWMAIAGPIMSAVIGFVCLGAAWTAGWRVGIETETPLLAIIVWLGYINIALAVFNMIPGFPMDGGRILRAAIWWITGNQSKATRGASITGQIIAFGFIILGLFSFFSGAGFGGLWIAFIGWFLLNAAKATYVQSEVAEGLHGVLVRDLMRQECPIIESRTDLQTLVDEHLLKTGERCFIVTEIDETVGIITPHEIKNVERRMWAFKTAADVMKPIEETHTVKPETPVSEALEIIGREDVNQLPVISDGRLEGIISRERILSYLLTRRELNL
jgi:CBS domain-containing protein